MLSDEVGEQIARLRKRAGKNREQLAERCAEVGYPSLTYGVIGSIETGRPSSKDGRRTREVTVDELAGLALALNMPAALLLADPRERPTVSLGGKPVDTLTVLQWLVGAMWPVDTPEADDMSARQAALFMQAVWTIAECTPLLRRPVPEGDEKALANARDAARRLHIAVERIRAQGAPVPDLGEHIRKYAADLGERLPEREGWTG